jgi:3-methylcrotonyl-CoA carboxylase alpha subunit
VGAARAVIRTLLVANRGEIACRVIRTARRLGIRAVAVYSEADRAALHVRVADEAVLIGPAPARESYLRVEAVIEAALASGADAIHPGYGFLAESPELAVACERAGVTWVGPPAEAIRAMGDKAAARELMRAAGVPVVPGAPLGDGVDPLALARELGFPLLVKATAGGGGKGMREVADESGLEAAIAAAGREAGSAFGDGRLLLERLLVRPRHVEVQLLADAGGDVRALGDRDCSLQRRHQKVVEEAPAPDLDPAVRRRLCDAAVAAGRAVGYVGAGTVEFLVAGDDVHFLEMNTRLQVEHPVTEEVLGLDLVELQLRVAEGSPLPWPPGGEPAPTGHAVEARLYAEDPARGFLPATGRLAHLRLPEGDGVRIDAGVETGDAVTVHYDPLLAKIVARGADRAEALRRLASALGEAQVAGVTTNLALLRAVIPHPALVSGPLDTGLLERLAPGLLPPPGPAPDAAVALAILALLLRDAEAGAGPSPWSRADGWRLIGEGRGRVTLRDAAGEREVEVVHRRGGGHRIVLGDRTVEAVGRLAAGGEVTAELDGRRVRAAVVRDGDVLSVLGEDLIERLEVVDPSARAEHAAAAGGLRAPMPGRVRSVLVGAGEHVRLGAPLVVLEAMKMEVTVSAPADGLVREVRCAEGDQVEEGAELLELEAEE